MLIIWFTRKLVADKISNKNLQYYVSYITFVIKSCYGCHDINNIITQQILTGVLHLLALNLSREHANGLKLFSHMNMERI